MEEAYTVRIIYQYRGPVLCPEKETQSIVGFVVLFGDREAMWKGSLKGRLKETGAESSQQLEREDTVTEAWPWSFREHGQPSQPLWTSVEPVNESCLASVMRAGVSRWEAGWPRTPRLKWSSSFSFPESLWEVWHTGESLCPWLRRAILGHSLHDKKERKMNSADCSVACTSCCLPTDLQWRSYIPTKSFPGRSRDAQKPTLKGWSKASASLETCKATQEK